MRCLFVALLVVFFASVHAEHRPLTDHERAVMEFKVLDVDDWRAHSIAHSKGHPDSALVQKVRRWTPAYEKALADTTKTYLNRTQRDSVAKVEDALARSLMPKRVDPVKALLLRLAILEAQMDSVNARR